MLLKNLLAEFEPEDFIATLADAVGLRGKRRGKERTRRKKQKDFDKWRRGFHRGNF
jgi:hypothetical protein